jgi:hypothetical protein
MRKLLILLLSVLLAACSLPHFITDVEPLYSTNTPEPATDTPVFVTDTPEAGAGYTECGWSWATQSLPDLSAKVQSALDTAGLEGITVSAEAFGENCFTRSGKVDHFATMETDFRFNVDVPDLADEIALGDRLERILVVLDAFPTDATPGPQPGYIGVHYIHEAEDLNLWFNVTASNAARAQGLHGADLLRELLNK